MLKYYDFSGVSFLVDKSFECENASENAAPRFDPAGPLITLTSIMDDYVHFVAPDQSLFYKNKHINIYTFSELQTS